MSGAGRSGEVLDAIVAHRRRLGDNAIPAWAERLLEVRDQMHPDDYDEAVALALRRNLFGDYEAPGDDPELGEAIG
jgi:hypothetical protein